MIIMYSLSKDIVLKSKVRMEHGIVPRIGESIDYEKKRYVVSAVVHHLHKEKIDIQSVEWRNYIKSKIGRRNN